jgi:hypothetical protein
MPLPASHIHTVAWLAFSSKYRLFRIAHIVALEHVRAWIVCCLHVACADAVLLLLLHSAGTAPPVS